MGLGYTTRSKILGTLIAAAVVSATLTATLSGCESSPASKGAPRGPVYSLRIIHSTDTSQFVRDVVDKFNATNQRLADGTTIQLSNAVFDDASSLQRISSGEMQAQLWLASSSLLPSIVRSKEANERAKLNDCQSLMKSRLGLAYRPEDKFLTQGGKTPLLQAALFSRSQGPAPASSVILASPRYTGTGAISDLALRSGAAREQIQSLTESTAFAPETVERSASVIRSFFTSESEALTYLSERSGGSPLFVLTTEQAAKLFKLYNPSTQIEWSPLEDQSAVADYPLCTIETRNSAGAESQALRLARAFFTAQAATDSLTSLGYDKPTPLEESSLSKASAVAAKLITRDAAPLRPSQTTFVIDASIRVDRPTMETIRREIKSFADTISDSSRVALIPASTNLNIPTPPSPKGADLDRAITRLTTSGGNAIRTGLSNAFDLYTDISLQKYRRAIVVFTTSDEPLTQEALTSLMNRADQYIGRRNVDLYVIGLGASPQEFASLAQLTKFVGGTFKMTTTANLPATLLPLMRQLQ